MKYLVLALFVAAAAAAPTPDANVEPVDLIVNGVPDGQPLEIGNIVDIKLKEHVGGVLAASSNLLHPLTAAGIAEAAAAAEAEQPQLPEIPQIPEIDLEPVIPAPIELPAIIPEPEVAPSPIELPGVNPEPVVIPAPIELPGVKPEPEVIPAPIELPGVNPEPVIVPSPIELPAIIPEPEIVPSPVEESELLPIPGPQIPNGEVFNNDIVQIHVNAPEEPGMFSSIHSWLSMVVNYFSNGIQTTQQIV